MRLDIYEIDIEEIDVIEIDSANTDDSLEVDIYYKNKSESERYTFSIGACNLLILALGAVSKFNK